MKLRAPPDRAQSAVTTVQFVGPVTLSPIESFVTIRLVRVASRTRQPWPGHPTTASHGPAPPASPVLLSQSPPKPTVHFASGQKES